MVAARLLGRALALAALPVQGVSWDAAALRAPRVARGRALAVLHQLDEAERELSAALGPTPLPEGPLDAVAVEGLLGLGELRRRQGREDEAQALLERMLDGATALADDRLQGEALRALGMLDYFAGRLRRAEERFSQAHSLAVRTGDSRGAGWALQQLAWSSTTRGDYAVAEEALAQAQQVFAVLEDTGGLSWSAGTEGLVRLLQGRYAEAREIAGGLLPLGEAMGDVWGAAACLLIEGYAAVELGDVSAGLAAAHAAHASFASIGDDWGRAFALVAQASAHRAAGDPGAALELLDEALSAAARAQTALGGLLAATTRGYCLLEAGRPQEAELAAHHALELLAGVDLEPHAAIGPTVLLAQARRAQGDLAGALELLRAGTDQIGSASLLFPRRQALAHLAGTLLQAGQPQQALEVAERAEGTHAEDVRSLVLSARALAAALAACGRPEQAREAAQEAVRRAGATGHQAELAASRALVSELHGS